MPFDTKTKKAIERDVNKILAETILKIVKNNFGYPRNYSEKDSFKNLLFDSLDYAYLCIELEDSFNIEINESETINFSNQEELKEYVIQKIEQREYLMHSKEYLNY